MFAERIKPLLKVNVSKVICNHLIGKEHSHGHRILVGVVITILGLVIGETFGSVSLFPHIILLSIKGIGGIVQGVGAVPIVEFLIIHGDKAGINEEIKIVERELADSEESISSPHEPCIG